ncbi:hypothetical protein GC174_13770 [bacterium]|nr:hypothetical protein [bacterium]
MALPSLFKLFDILKSLLLTIPVSGRINSSMATGGSNQLKSSTLGLSALVCVLLLRFDQAEKLLTRAIEAADQLPYNYGLRAYVRIRLEDYAGAIEDATVKITLRPDDASSYALRAWARYCLDQYAEVVQDVEASLAIAPERRTFYQDSLRLIDSYQNLGRDREAIEFCEELIELSRFDYFTLELLVRQASSHMNLEDYEESLKSLDRAFPLAGRSDRAELHRLKSDVLELMGKDSLAEEEKSRHQELKLFQARLTEWVPASPTRRLLANFLDALILATTVSLVLGILILLSSFVFYSNQMADFDMVSLMVPYLLSIFLLSFIDSFIVFLIPALLLLVLWNISLTSTPAWQGQFLSAAVLLFLFSSAQAYTMLFEASSLQATPGKFYLGLRVTDNEGEIVSLHRTAWRHLLKTIPSVLAVSITAAFFFVIAYDLHLFLKVICILFLAAMAGLLWAAAFRPGLHNLFTGATVSDVRLYGALSKQFGLFRN